MTVRSRPVVALLVLLSFLGTTNAWHATDDDADFRPQATGHDHSGHDERLRSQPTADAPGHCALCHWLQAFGTGRTEQPALAFRFGTLGARRIVSAQAARSSDLSQRSPRGPPA